MNPFELLTELNALDEHSRIEAKSASEVGKSLLETICAFANEPNLGGGWIALGAKLDEHSLFRQYMATGLADPDKIQRDLVSQCATAFNRPIRVQIESGLVIRVMRELMESANLTPPTFNSDRTRNQFIVTCLFHHFLSPEDWAWLRTFGDADLCSEEARALVYAREIGAVDNATYRHLNRVDVLNASTHLRRLRDRGLLEQKGKGSDTYYIPTERLLAPWRKLQGNAPATDVSTDTASQIAPGTPPQSSKPAPQSSKLAPQSSKAEAQSAKAAYLLAENPGLPEELAHSLAGLKGKAASLDLQQVAYRLCSWNPLTRAELARLLGRNDAYTHTRIIRPMILSGRLEMSIPGQPNHPAQRYRATTAPSENQS